jgi:hypothetical protein
MRRQSEEFGKRVRDVLEAHGNMSNRGADRKTGVNYATISNMAVGQIPEMESVVRFARGFDLDVNEWLQLAGYEPIHNTSHRLLDAVKELERELGRPVYFAGSDLLALRERHEELHSYVAALREIALANPGRLAGNGGP